MAIDGTTICVWYEKSERWVESHDEDISRAVAEFTAAEGVVSDRYEWVKSAQSYYLETRIRRVLLERFPVNFSQCSFRCGVAEYVVESWAPWATDVSPDIAERIDGPGSFGDKMITLAGGIPEGRSNPCSLLVLIALIVVVANVRFI